MTREATEVCLRVLKESNKSKFDSYSVRNSVLIISHITYRDCQVHIFSDNLSRNSCILKRWIGYSISEYPALFTDSPSVPPSERRQTPGLQP